MSLLRTGSIINAYKTSSAAKFYYCPSTMWSVTYRVNDTVEFSRTTYKVALMDIRSASDGNHVCTIRTT